MPDSTYDKIRRKPKRLDPKRLAMAWLSALATQPSLARLGRSQIRGHIAAQDAVIEELAERVRELEDLLRSESHRLVKTFFDDEAGVHVGEYIPRHVLSQGNDRSEAEQATMDAVLLRIAAKVRTE